MLNMKFFQELFEPLAIELGTIVRDDGLREAITTYDGFSDESFDLGSSDIGHKFGFYRFGEVVHRDEEKSLL